MSPGDETRSNGVEQKRRSGGLFGGGPGGPGMRLPAPKTKDFKGSARRLIGYLSVYRWSLIVVFVAAILGAGFQVAGPRVLGQATNVLFDAVLSKQSVDFDAMGRVLAGLAVVYSLSAVFVWLQGYLMAGITQRTVYRLRKEVDEKLGRLPLKYFDDTSRGDTLSRITNDIDNIANTLSQAMTQMMTSFLQIIGTLVMMFWISPLLASLSLLLIPLSIFTTMFIAKRSQKQFVAMWDRTGKLNGHVEEMFTGHNVVKVFGRQDEAIRIFDEENAGLYDASFRAQFISGTIQPALGFLSNLNYVAIAVIGGLRVAAGQITLGEVQAFIIYTRQLQQPITQVAAIANVLQSTVASAERVFELLDAQDEVPDSATPEHLTGGVAAGHVEFRDVSFRYKTDVPLIEDLGLEAKPGQTIAIVGPTGAGKTTLVNLLMRFYEIDAGAILVDGHDIRDLTRDELRTSFGMVLQDTWLFGGTIRENIAYGAESPTDDEIHAAATAAYVDHFVRTLPDGYDTVLNDDASNISAGQKQLLTIARAFLADPRILILDEATSSVDTRTESLIQKAMSELMKGRTSFVIAHRLSTIRDADTILVMDQGRIIEKGTHLGLLAEKGFYHELYNSQFTEPLDEAV